MALIAPQIIDRAGDGLTPALSVASAGGDEFANSGREFLVVRATTAPCIVTAVTPQQVSGLPVGDEAFNVPASGERWIGPFPTQTFNNGQGRVALTYSAPAGVSVAVVRLGA